MQHTLPFTFSSTLFSPLWPSSSFHCTRSRKQERNGMEKKRENKKKQYAKPATGVHIHTFMWHTQAYTQSSHPEFDFYQAPCDACSFMYPCDGSTSIGTINEYSTGIAYNMAKCVWERACRKKGPRTNLKNKKNIR